MSLRLLLSIPAGTQAVQDCAYWQTAFQNQNNVQGRGARISRYCIMDLPVFLRLSDRVSIFLNAFIPFCCIPHIISVPILMHWQLTVMLISISSDGRNLDKAMTLGGDPLLFLGNHSTLTSDSESRTTSNWTPDIFDIMGLLSFSL